MLEFQSVSFRNFCSFGNQETVVDLSHGGTTFIIGENIDKGGSSGAGKSTIINAICYCLFDKTPAKIGKERLINNINNDTKNTQMEVKLSFKKDGASYIITRARGENTNPSITKNGGDITPASVNNLNKKIEEIIGCSYDLFTRVVMFNGNETPFLDLAVNEQRLLIEELLKITTLSEKAVLLKDEIRATEQGIEVQKVIIKQQEAQNELHQKHLKEAQDRITRWESQRKHEYAVAEQQLAKIIDVDFEAEELLHAEVARLQPQETQYAADVKTAKRELTELEKKLTTLEQELTHLSDKKCPYCLQKYADANKKIAELKETRAELKEQHKKKFMHHEVLLAKLEEAAAELKEISSLKKYDNLKELIKIRNNAETMGADLEKLSTQVNPHLEAYEALKKEDAVKVDYTTLNDLTSLLEHQKFLLKLLTDKNSFIRKKIISKTIPFMNKRIAHYVDELLLPHNVVFQPDMSCEITEFGRQLDHGNLSNGEKKRLNLSLSLAFRDVLTHLHASMNVMFTDEIDGGSMDSGLVDAVIRLLKHKAWDEKINIYIISHRPEFDGRCDHNITVRKENGFSTLLLDDKASH